MLTTREEANLVLAAWVPRHNARFAIAAADPAPAWRPLPGGLEPEGLFCFRHVRVVARDGTFTLAGESLMLATRVGRGGWADGSSSANGSTAAGGSSSTAPSTRSCRHPSAPPGSGRERSRTHRGHRRSWPSPIVPRPTIPGDATLAPGTSDKVAGRQGGQDRWPSTVHPHLWTIVAVASGTPRR
jgi:hypothetical protein